MTLFLPILPFTVAIILLLNITMHAPANAAEIIPDDVRYMLEDLYGANKNDWPSPIYKKDLNSDGIADLVAIKKDCKLGEHCPAELFICLPDKSRNCVEYCYIETKTLVNIEKNVRKMKCESTC